MIINLASLLMLFFLLFTLGFCSSNRDRLLIYEYLERGSLDSWLYDDDLEMNCLMSLLTWPVRVKIIKGVAAGLKFLHDECDPPVIHRDIKASNVLLDRDFQARICDFGLARHMDGSQSHVSTQAAGTMGYAFIYYYIQSCIISIIVLFKSQAVANKLFDNGFQGTFGTPNF